MLPLAGRSILIGYAFLAAAVLFILGPTFWIFLNSIKYQIAIYTGAWIFEPTLQNYIDVLFGRRVDLMSNIRNSLIVAAGSTLAVLVVGTLGAYAIHRSYVRTFVARLLLAWLLLFHMIPPLTLVGPWYLLFQELGLYDSLWGLVLTHVAINLPLTMWIMLTFFRDPAGQKMLMVCVVMQVMGYIWIRKVIQIKV